MFVDTKGQRWYNLIKMNFFYSISQRKSKGVVDMAGLSNSIEAFLKEMLNNSDDDYIEIGRNDLASQFNCAPSQINYVLTTRFTPYKGYYIESRRGGSGYVKIIKLTIKDDNPIKEIVDDVIGDKITKDKSTNIIKMLLDEDLITDREALVMMHALEDNTLSKVDFNDRNILRADLLKNMLLAFMR